MVNVDNRPGGPRGSNNTLYFIVGALVIAVLIIGYFMYGGDDVDDAADVNVTTEEPATAGDAPDVDVDVDAEPPADAAAPATPPPAEPATPATPPAEPATPPAGGTAPAPQ